MTTALVTTPRRDLRGGAGVNTRFWLDPSVYSEHGRPRPRILNAIYDLGVGYVREWWRPHSLAQKAAFTALADNGVGVHLYIGDLTYTPAQAAADVAALARAPFVDAVIAISGPNEPNSQGGDGWAQKAVALQRAIYSEAFDHPALARVAIVGSALKENVADLDADYRALADAGIARWCTAGDFHCYPGDDGAVAIAREARRSHQAYGRMLLWNSETGWTTAEIDERLAGRFAVEALLRNHLDGIAGTIVYGMADESEYLPGRKGYYGLMTATRPKSGYEDIQALLTPRDGHERFPGFLGQYSDGVESDVGAVVTSEGNSQWTVHFLRNEQDHVTLLLPAKYCSDRGRFHFQTGGTRRVTIKLPETISPVYVRPSMLVGAATDQSEDAFEKLEYLVGRMGVRRTYESSLPATFANTAARTDAGLRASWQSVKSNWANTAAGVYDDAITAFAKSVPDGHNLMLTWQHEPENDGGVAADFIKGYQRFYSVVKDVRPDILVGPIFIGWTFDSRNGNRQATQAAYADPIGAKYMDFAGIDPYNTYHFPPAGNKDNWDEAPLQAYTNFIDWCDNLAIPTGIAETACAVDTTHGGGVQRKIDWTDTMIQTCDDAGCLAFCWFDTNINHDLDPSMLIEAQPEFIDAWSVQVAIHPLGV